jgi:uncharacterized membrane protein
MEIPQNEKRTLTHHKFITTRIFFLYEWLATKPFYPLLKRGCMVWLSFLFLLLLGTGTQYTISIGDSGIAEIHQNVTTTSEGGRILVVIPFNVEEETLLTYVQGISVSPTVGRVSDMTTVEIMWEGGEEVLVELEYYVIDITGKEKDTWYLTLPSLDGAVSVLLPENVSIDYIVYAGDFPRIRQVKNRLELELESMSSPLSVYYSYEMGKSEVASTIELGAILLSLVAAASIMTFYFLKTRHKRAINPSILSVLDERERSIVLFLAQKGTMKQAKISRATGIPKTSLSKILARLAERNIVAMTRDGNTTLCSLRDDIIR